MLLVAFAFAALLALVLPFAVVSIRFSRRRKRTYPLPALAATAVRTDADTTSPPASINSEAHGKPRRLSDTADGSGVSGAHEYDDLPIIPVDLPIGITDTLQDPDAVSDSGDAVIPYAQQTEPGWAYVQYNSDPICASD